MAAEGCGFDAVWVAGGPDPATLAGALAAATTSVTLGVISGVGARDRNPSILARDLTAVDVLSSGRAAVMLEGAAGPAAEAARVCRLLFAGGEAHHAGPWFHLDGAVNLPPPVGSPLVLVHSPSPRPRCRGRRLGHLRRSRGRSAAWRREAGGTALLLAGPAGRGPVGPGCGPVRAGGRRPDSAVPPPRRAGWPRSPDVSADPRRSPDPGMAVPRIARCRRRRSRSSSPC